jgi:predicted nucleic acid-binding protein
MRISNETYARAARLGPDGLRSLDALHLACALELGDELGGIVTYDDRLARPPRRTVSRSSHPGRAGRPCLLDGA